MKTEFINAIYQTIYMTIVSALFAGILGLLTGVALVITQEGGLAEDKLLYNILDKVVNLLRSVPFIILLAVILNEINLKLVLLQLHLMLENQWWGSVVECRY